MRGGHGTECGGNFPRRGLNNVQKSYIYFLSQEGSQILRKSEKGDNQNFPIQFSMRKKINEDLHLSLSARSRIQYMTPYPHIKPTSIIPQVSKCLIANYGGNAFIFRHGTEGLPIPVLHLNFCRGIPQ